MRHIGKNIKTSIFTTVFMIIVVFLTTNILSCSKENKEITGEELSEYVLELDQAVDVSRENVEEFSLLEKQDIENMTPLEILESISLDYQYEHDTQKSEDCDILTADLVDGRKIMIVRFDRLTKIEAFFIQFQSNLDTKGYTFNQRLKYSDICNSYEGPDEGAQAYLLKRSNYLIMLLK